MRAEIAAQFRDGWAPRPGPQDRQRTLTAREHAWALQAIETGSRTALGPEVVRVVRAGAQPGDPLPPPERRPFISGVSDDAEVITTGTTGHAPSVAIIFSCDAYPGIRFGHQFARPDDKHSLIWLMEEIETGALHRMMRSNPVADDAGITWTTFPA